MPFIEEITSDSEEFVEISAKGKESTNVDEEVLDTLDGSAGEAIAPAFKDKASWDSAVIEDHKARKKLKKERAQAQVPRMHLGGAANSERKRDDTKKTTSARPGLFTNTSKTVDPSKRHRSGATKKMTPTPNTATTTKTTAKGTARATSSTKTSTVTFNAAQRDALRQAVYQFQTKDGIEKAYKTFGELTVTVSPGDVHLTGVNEENYEYAAREALNRALSLGFKNVEINADNQAFVDECERLINEEPRYKQLRSDAAEELPAIDEVPRAGLTV